MYNRPGFEKLLRKWTKRDVETNIILDMHDIFGRFIPASFKIGKRNPITYMAVIPIGRRFHM